MQNTDNNNQMPTGRNVRIANALLAILFAGLSLVTFKWGWDTLGESREAAKLDADAWSTFLFMLALCGGAAGLVLLLIAVECVTTAITTRPAEEYEGETLTPPKWVLYRGDRMPEVKGFWDEQGFCVEGDPGYEDRFEAWSKSVEERGEA